MRNSSHTYFTRRRERGFTLVEMMLVVAIIAILAGVALVAYRRHVRSGRIVSAQEFVSVIQARQEIYFQQNGTYVTTHATNAYPPLATNDEPRLKDWNPSDAGWVSLGARPPANGTTFSYIVVASATTTTPAHAVPSGSVADQLGIPQPPSSMAPRPWYYVVGHADLDGDATYTNGRCTSGLLNPDDCTAITATSARSAIVVHNAGE
jgi:prepilin-type N-terminal cleavage/methylation domain-containing protein